MNEEAASTQDGGDANPSPPTQVAKPFSPLPPQAATEEHLTKVEGEMNAFERSTLKWTRATFGILFVTGLFICLQWIAMRQTLGEMKRSGETATTQLWQAIGNMNWLARTSDSATQQAKINADLMFDQNKKALRSAIAQGKASLDASIESLEWSQRPWIAESSQIAEPIAFNINGANITFLFTLDNVGHSPAEKVWVEAKLINIVSGGMPSVEDHRRVCDGPTSTAPKNFTLGEILFPGKPFSWAWSWTIPWSEIQGPRAPNILGPLLYGCIEYSYGLSTKRHSTPFRYSVIQSDGRLLVQDGGFTISTKAIPQSMLGLRREGMLGQPNPN